MPSERQNYSEIKCYAEHILKIARQECNCLPILMMLNFTMDNNDYCNIEGSECFRQAVEKAKSKVNESHCPSLCTKTQLHAMPFHETWDDPMKFGPECTNFLAANPWLFLKKNEPEFPMSFQDYVDSCSERFSFVQIYFDNPQKTVIIKDAKITVPDMVSNIGGTIGIFLGLSTISVLDIIIEWLMVFKVKFFEIAEDIWT